MDNKYYREQLKGQKSYLEILQEQQESMKFYPKDKKFKKFFGFAIPILLLEIVAVILLVTYLLILPKNYCRISTNNKEAVIYVNDKKTNKFRMENAEDERLNYFYQVNVEIELPGSSTYLITYEIECDKYSAYASTSATNNNGVYSMEVVGGKRTKLFSGITIVSSEKVKSFNVDVDVTIKKI